MNKDIREEVGEEYYALAEDMIFVQNKTVVETLTELIMAGADKKHAAMIIKDIREQADAAYREKIDSDKLYGAVLFTGGLIASIAGIGHVLWEVIFYGIGLFYRGFSASRTR
jgi:hypothetical protein